MESKDAKLLFDAVKTDDEKAFSKLVSSNADLKVRFGRFPLLSVCYLFESYKILTKYEKALFSSSNTYNFVFEEYFDIYKKFRKYAKKSLRLYGEADAIVEPAEMLAILGRREMLVSNYKKLHRTEKTVSNIKKIFVLNFDEDVCVSTAEVKLAKGKPNFKQKVFSLLLVAVMIVFSLLSGGALLAVGTFAGFGTENSPIKISTEQEFLTAIAGGTACYKLENDITLSHEVDPQNFGGTFDGNGHKIVAGNKLKNGLISMLSGTIKNLKIEINFEELVLQSDYAVVAKAVTGKIDNLEVSGSVKAKMGLTEIEATENSFFSIFAANNAGEIKNSVSKVNVVAENHSGKNSFVSAIAGENSGKIFGCKNLAEKIEAETVDLAGIVAINSGEVENCENHATIYQTSGEQWSPNCTGIVIANQGLVKNCKNFGEVSAVSTFESQEAVPTIYCAGVVLENIGEVSLCENFANISADGKSAIVFASGVVCRNLVNGNIQGKISQSNAKCKVTTKSDGSNAYGAGVVAVNTGLVSASNFEGEIESTSSLGAVSAGICAENYYGQIRDCFAKTTFTKNDSPNNLQKVHLIRFSFDMMPVPIAYSSGNKYVSTDPDVAGGCGFIRATGGTIIFDDASCGCEQVQENASEENLKGEVSV